MRTIAFVIAAAALFSPAATAAPSIRSRDLKAKGDGKGGGDRRKTKKEKPASARTCKIDSDCQIRGCGEGVCECRKEGKRNLKGRREKRTHRCEEGEGETVCKVDPCTLKAPFCDDGQCTSGAEDAAVGRADLTKPTLIRSGENDSLDFTLNTFSTSVLDDYGDCDGLADDLTQAARHLTSKIIQRYAEYGDKVMIAREPVAPAMATATATAPDGSKNAESESSFETNNQVEGVHEADIVKSDGDRVYAAYGDKVVVWTAATGVKVAEMKMPEPYFDPTGCGHDPYPRPMDKETSKLTATKKSIIIGPGYPGCHRPRARVDRLLLHGTTLVAFVSGYNSYYAQPRVARDKWPILQDFGSVQARTYNTSSLVDSAVDGALPELKLLGKEDLPGRLSDARSVGPNAHVVTMTGIDTYQPIQRHIERWDERYWGMDKEEYIKSATEYATSEVIPNFVKRFVDELKERHGDSCADIARLSVFQTGDLTKEASENHWWDQGVFGGICSVSSFDMGAPIPASGLGGNMKTTAAFLPNIWGTTVYATANHLFLAGRGYESHPELGYVENTMIHGYELPQDSSSAAKAIGVGKVLGTVLNQFSLDFYEEHLRVATTVRARWGCVEQVTGGCRWQQISNPINKVTVLGMPSGGEPLMEVAGQTPHLGKPNESITAVRFIKDWGFVVTFERIDPFIVLDLKDPTNPLKSGELEISGWSNYLHPGNGDTIIAVGQEADSEGQRMGLQISLFSFADRTAPKALAKYVSDEKWSSSPVQWDHKAFRFLPKSEVVILPATANGYGQDFFDGFYIFDVKEDGITLRFEVNLANKDVYYPGRCYYSGYLQSRSMVFNDQVTLMKAHFVESYDLNSEGDEANWKLDLDKDLPKDQCHYDYWWRM